MARREDIELQLVLNDPDEARRYIESFDWFPLDPPKYIVLGLDEKIYLDNMTDEEAVIAAKIILRDIEISAIMREKQKELQLFDWWGH